MLIMTLSKKANGGINYTVDIEREMVDGEMLYCMANNFYSDLQEAINIGFMVIDMMVGQHNAGIQGMPYFGSEDSESEFLESQIEDILEKAES